MIFLYDLGIQLYLLIIRIVALRNKKARQWVNGQKNIVQNISAQISTNQPCIWFHFASLGEFEQGRPVMEQVKNDNPDEKLVITFFSPSGYEIRKHNALSADTFYLPIDTKENARALISVINPKIAVFTKYEYWYHYYKELHSRNIPIYIISANFRKGMSFFKWYGVLNRKMLKFVTHFFVQNAVSKENLKLLNYTNVTVTGDTRFDRVMHSAMHPKKLDLIQAFCMNNKVFIGGSTWPEEEVLIAQLIKEYPDWKFILAPHEIDEDKIAKLEEKLHGKSVRYSQILESEAGSRELDTSDTSQYPSEPIFIRVGPVLNTQYAILIIDNIGMLSSLYQYASIAYIGGAFGAGLHNVLEAAAFGIPVIFGPKYNRFPEAGDLIERGAGFSIQNMDDLRGIMKMLQDDAKRSSAGKAARKYVVENTGATQLIMDHIRAAL
ncbi:MAG TPA: glycosyltransferase N-terminal domain-containing protein [Sphingobacteriaceae bacterium]